MRLTSGEPCVSRTLEKKVVLVEFLVKMEGVKKTFPGVVALDGIDFTLLPGETHIILGENGAGKSTLIKVLSGVYEPDAGSIALQEGSFSRLTTKQALDMGIQVIYQELSNIEQLPVYENIFVGNLLTKKRAGIRFVDHKSMLVQARYWLDQVGLKRDAATLMSELSISERQMVEIAKAISTGAKIIVMDEPTSSLTQNESNALFELIRRLNSEGVGIIYISHKLDEVHKIGSRVTVLKDGKRVDTRNIDDVTVDDCVRMMVGRELEKKYKQIAHDKKAMPNVLLSVKNLTRKDRIIHDVSFDLYENEILGFAGLIGSGRTELMDAIFGAARIETGSIKFKGKLVDNRSPFKTVKNGFSMIPENRREAGVFNNFSVWKNIASAKLIKKSRLSGFWGFVNPKIELEEATTYAQMLDIRSASMEQNIMELSGGNQQKTILAKWLMAEADILIFDEPTRGIDVSTKNEIYKMMQALVRQGKGIIMVSSELPELILNCTRVAVFRDGEIVAIAQAEDINEEYIMRHAAR